MQGGSKPLQLPQRRSPCDVTPLLNSDSPVSSPPSHLPKRGVEAEKLHWEEPLATPREPWRLAGLRSGGQLRFSRSLSNGHRLCIISTSHLQQSYRRTQCTSPFLFVPALHIAPPRGASSHPASQPDCQKCPPSMPALTPARGSGIFVSGFPFYPFPRQALNRYQLPFSWHRWLKTASAHVHGPQGLAG